MTSTLTGVTPELTVEHMSEETVWKIAIRDEIRAFMATNPEPLWAASEAERDWHFAHSLHRPREDYEAVEVPAHDAVRREIARFSAVRAELHAKRRAEWSRQRGEA